MSVNFGKRAEVYMIDDEVTGRVVCEFPLLSARLYKIPRTKLKESKEIKELQTPGVYILTGEQDGKDCIYVGQSIDVYKRLVQHLNPNEDYWNECLAYISTSNKFDKAIIGYLENTLYNRAKDAKRYIVNQVEPTKDTISLNGEDTAIGFIEGFTKLSGVIGYKIFNKIVDDSIDDNNTFYINTKSATSKAKLTDEGLVVLEGSTISNDVSNSLRNEVKILREKLLNDGVLDENNTFKNDYIFKSPSAAASFILGSQVNGWNYWKDKNGKTLNEVYRET